MIKENKLLAVIRIRGSKQLRLKINNTLNCFLKLTRKNHLVLILETQSSLGWLQLCKDYITWAEANEETLKLLNEKPSTEKNSLKHVFRLAPPKGGFKKTIKLPFPKGALGKRTTESMNKLIEKMLNTTK